MFSESSPSYFDGQRAVTLNVFRVGNQAALELAETVREYAKNVASGLPAGVSIDTWFDRSIFLRKRLRRS